VNVEKSWLFRNRIECYFWENNNNSKKIDYLEVDSNSINAVWFKWNNKGKTNFPKTLLGLLPDATTRGGEFLDQREFINEFLS